MCFIYYWCLCVTSFWFGGLVFAVCLVGIAYACYFVLLILCVVCYGFIALLDIALMLDLGVCFVIWFSVVFCWFVYCLFCLRCCLVFCDCLALIRLDGVVAICVFYFCLVIYLLFCFSLWFILLLCCYCVLGLVFIY